MKTYTKIAKDKEYYKTEVEALTLLGDTNIVPQLVDCDEESLRIEMELIELPHLKLEEIYKKGNQAIYDYAKAEYHVRKTLLEKGIFYSDWKNEHLFYDALSGILKIIDFEGVNIVGPQITASLIEILNNKYSFLGKEDYEKDQTFVTNKKEMSSDMWVV